MRFSYVVALILTIAFAASYYHETVGAICRVPVEWRVGEVDERFTLTPAEVRTVVENAAEVWESATGRELFTYNPTADFTVNFIFDERQRTTNEAEDFLNTLDEKEIINEQINATYEELVARYDNKEAMFLVERSAFETALEAYNTKVANYNTEGGAPPEVFAELQAEQASLDAEQARLSQLARELNVLGSEINQLSERGNELVREYNEDVGRYNQTFGHREGFTQGDYRGDQINIYNFSAINELTLVMTHELGHALWLDHVDDEQAVMYYLMGEQSLETIALTESDLAHFDAVCTQNSVNDQIRQWFSGFF